MNQIAIGKRLCLGFGLLLALSLLGTLLGRFLQVWQLHTASVSTQAVIEQPLAKERLISDWYRQSDPHGRTPHHGHCQKQRCVLVDLFCRRAEQLSASTTTDICRERSKA